LDILIRGDMSWEKGKISSEKRADGVSEWKGVIRVYQGEKKERREGPTGQATLVNATAASLGSKKGAFSKKGMGNGTHGRMPARQNSCRSNNRCTD